MTRSSLFVVEGTRTHHHEHEERRKVIEFISRPGRILSRRPWSPGPHLVVAVRPRTY